jgi:hypothetical protein
MSDRARGEQRQRVLGGGRGSRDFLYCFGVLIYV